MAVGGMMVWACLSGGAFATDGTESSGGSGPAVGHVNAWPLFYQRGEELDVLWPVYHQSSQGHRVFPLYSYRKSPAWVNLVLGVAGEFDFGNRDYRILNFGWDNLKQSRYCFPVYYQNDRDKELCVFPLFYREKKDKEKPATWITLPYSKGPDFSTLAACFSTSKKIRWSGPCGLPPGCSTTRRAWTARAAPIIFSRSGRGSAAVRSTRRTRRV
jgi:hypothetical protein